MSGQISKIVVVSIRRDDGRNSHARVTSGLTAALQRAFPSASLEIWAGARDWREIVARLRQGECATDCLLHGEVDVGGQWTRVPGLGRLRHLAWLARLVAGIRRSGADLVVLADYGTRDLLRWKQLERAGLRLPRLLVVLHGGIEPPWKGHRRVAGAASNYRAAIEWRGSPAIHYLALAPSAAATLSLEMPALASRLHAIDIPELGCETAPLADRWRPGEPIRVGFVGGTWGRKGFRRFVEMAESVAAHTRAVEFALVGEPQREAAGYSTAEWRELSTLIAGLNRERLEGAAYAAEIARLTYVSFLGDPESYARQASLTIVDAFAQQVPVLGLANPLLRDLEARLGEFGALVGSVAEASGLLVRSAEEFPLSVWSAQRDAMAAGRRVFTPERAAPRLREVCEHLMTAVRSTSKR